MKLTTSNYEPDVNNCMIDIIIDIDFLLLGNVLNGRK